ncbi:MAG: VIT1/CCC1 transporter family protein [Chloroflexi bacterium]|nr:VIT1/CCC1 transporter family protein [Chloroflexota bacterium]
MRTQHLEWHFGASGTLRDIIIGMSDGLTVPFALAAGLSGAVASTGIIVTAGLAEITAGAISMGLGGYLAARSDIEHYVNERQRERGEVVAMPEQESVEVSQILQSYGLTTEESAPVVAALRRKPEAWVDFMMRFELGLEAPDPKRALASAVTIGASYAVGGLIPLSPYIALTTASSALPLSITVTLTALGIFGFIKGHFTGAQPLRSTVQTMLIGGATAAAAFALARAVS